MSRFAPRNAVAGNALCPGTTPLCSPALDIICSPTPRLTSPTPSGLGVTSRSDDAPSGHAGSAPVGDPHLVKQINPLKMQIDLAGWKLLPNNRMIEPASR